jgi:hypothetical protein
MEELLNLRKRGRELGALLDDSAPESPAETVRLNLLNLDDGQSLTKCRRPRRPSIFELQQIASQPLQQLSGTQASPIAKGWIYLGARKDIAPCVERALQAVTAAELAIALRSLDPNDPMPRKEAGEIKRKMKERAASARQYRQRLNAFTREFKSARMGSLQPAQTGLLETAEAFVATSRAGSVAQSRELLRQVLWSLLESERSLVDESIERNKYWREQADKRSVGSRRRSSPEAWGELDDHLTSQGWTVQDLANLIRSGGGNHQSWAFPLCPTLVRNREHDEVGVIEAWITKYRHRRRQREEERPKADIPQRRKTRV